MIHSESVNKKMKDAEKIELHNNEFGVKYRTLRAETEQKYLIYTANWHNFTFLIPHLSKILES